MKIFKAKQWKYTDKKTGEVVVVSQRLDDVLGRIRQYSNIGSILVSSNPTIAALAWGGFNLLLQVAGSDAEMAVKVAEAMADIIDYIHIYQPYKEQYMHSETNSGKKVYDLLSRLYADIKNFCEQAVEYYQQSTARRIGKAVLTPFSIEFGPALKNIKNTTILIASAAASAEFEDNKRHQLLQWLSSVHYHDAHESQRRNRSAGTCDWLLQKDEFFHWKQANKSSLLWLHGNVGCGKSVLMSNVVDHLLSLPGRNPTTDPVTYFYCNYDDIETLPPSAILATILKQLVATRSSIPRALTAAFTLHQSKGSPSTKHALREIEAYLSDVLNSPGLETVYILLDGLDECPLTPKRHARHWDPRPEILRVLVGLINQFNLSSPMPKIKILVSSRPMVDIKYQLERYPNIAVEGTDNKPDIIKYITSHLAKSVSDGRAIRRPIQDEPALEQLIIDTLTDKVNGMFLWAKLLLDQICDENTVAAVRKALQNLPDDYQEVYLRILKNLEAHTPANRQLARLAIAWVFSAIRPLSVAELTEALVVDIPGRRFDQEAKCGGEVILEVCLNLIVTDTYNGNTYFRFVHFSVHEFFRELGHMDQEDFPPGLEPSPEFDFSVDVPEIREEILNTCLTYLSFDPFARGPWNNDTLFECRNSFDAFILQYPFLDYAAVFWTNHLGTTDVNDDLTSSISRLFDLQLNICLSFQVYWFRNLVDGFPLNIPPLHIASFFGLAEPLTVLLKSFGVKGANETDGLGRNALHWAVLNGHKKATELLLDADVEIKTIDKKGYNALGLASLTGHQEIVTTLLARRKNVYEQEKEQLAIALLAATQGSFGEVVEILLDAGADPNLHVNEDMDPLWYAAWKGDSEIVNKLLDAGAEVDSGRKYGNALQEAAASGSLEVAGILIAAGADIDAQGGTAGSALNAAAWRGYYDIVELLLNMDATIRFKDDKFGGALALAESMGHTKVVDLILEYAPDDLKAHRAAAVQAASGQQHNNTQQPVSPPKPINPLSDISVEGMEIAVRSLFATLEQGDLDTARLMMTFGANILNTAVDNEDIPFLNRFCETITLQTEAIQKIKNSELMDLIYGLFEGLFNKLQISAHRETILSSLRTALGSTLQSLMDQNYAPMLKGLVIYREKKVIDIISRETPNNAEVPLKFAGELIRIGVRVRGHTMIARGFARIYVNGVEALSKRGVATDVLDELVSSADTSKGGMLKSGTAREKQDLVVLCEVAHAAKMEGCLMVQKLVEAALVKLTKNVSTAEVDGALEERVKELLTPPVGSIASGEVWEHDVKPWWDCYLSEGISESDEFNVVTCTS